MVEQLNQNNVQLECIRVNKVYDWVFDAVSNDTNITVPADCTTSIALAIQEGRIPLNVKCELPEVTGFFPLTSSVTQDDIISCTVSSIIDRASLENNLAVVKVLFSFRPLITVFDSNEQIICQFRPIIQDSQQLVVCVPDSFTRQNIQCRYISLQCRVNFNETGVPDLGLQVSLDFCYDLQVEAEVKLEVLSKFCFPRENDIEIPSTTSCPVFNYPEQCPAIFPLIPCDCSAFVEIENLIAQAGTVIGYTINLSANICPNCNYNSSTWSYSQISPTGDVTTVEPLTISLPQCSNIDGGAISMDITGTARVTDPMGIPENRPYQLTFVETPGGLLDVYLLVVTDVPLIVSSASVPTGEITIINC
ncbi:hypothetical protein LS684_08680 [Cytobacillus spongiae]|jgi:hypothetical protein|uniref:hypothetical protein n=1 Tax=Cytobacillus spongiae TaxID=2901381 RepID=UPI001F17A03D|nr:hypothetical protein [Cytobacillus spongiae]UII57493.1 hypothetical protein LS684_08680 [Cytobacillus spongiae]